MRRSTFKRDLLGTTLMFIALSIFTFGIMYLEKFLDMFKSH